MAERLYQHRPYMVDGMYVIGIKPRSLGEGVIPVVYSVDYTKVWEWWREHAGPYAIYQWRNGALKIVGRKMRSKTGFPYYTPVPPAHLEDAG